VNFLICVFNMATLRWLLISIYHIYLLIVSLLIARIENDTFEITPNQLN